MSEHYAICNLCGERMRIEDLLLHLRVEHDLDPTIEVWPDGEPVIIDATLSPDDFEQGNRR